MAQLVVTAINGGGTGYSASLSSSGATVTVTAPAGSGVAGNGTVTVAASIGVSISPALLAFAGGVDPSSTAPNLVITALGPKQVQNPNFSGPNATLRRTTRRPSRGTMTSVQPRAR